MDRVVALIAAAGRGTRMAGSFEKKQYVALGGQPILARSISIFERCPLIAEILVVVCPEDINFCRREVVERYGFKKVTRVVPGGEERQDSVYNGLTAIEPEPDMVLIHDGVRPFFPGHLIPEIVQAVREHQAAVVAVPVKDTIKIADKGGVARETPDRSNLWAVQTPQAFSFPLLLRAYREARNKGLKATDDAMLVEALGQAVKLVPGTYENLKITTPEDLIIAAALLEKGGVS